MRHLFIVICLVLVSLLDVLFTYEGLSVENSGYETNPVALYFWDWLGVWGLIVLKFTTLIFVVWVYFLVYGSRVWLSYGLVLFYMVVNVWAVYLGSFIYFYDNRPLVVNYELNDSGVLHCLYGPAMIDINGTKEWWLDGKRHRTDGPAIEWFDGKKCWYIEGKLHRTDGPAIERSGSVREWYIGGKLHRTDGPAKETHDLREWWLDGKRHRTDGPAVEWSDGDCEWWLDGVKQK